jgi:hypothetical protein
MIELKLFEALRWASRALIPGIGVYLYDFCPFVSLIQSVTYLDIACCFIYIAIVDLRT